MDDSQRFFYLRNSDNNTFFEVGGIVVHWINAAPAYIQGAVLNSREDEPIWVIAQYTLAQAVNLFAPRPAGVVPLMSQRDPAWAKNKLGVNDIAGSTIGRYGCVVTALAMMLTAYSGVPLNPTTVNNQLCDVDGFVGDWQNEVAWAKVQEAFPEYCTYRTSQQYDTDPADVAVIDAAVAAGHSVLIKVDMSFSRSGVQPHYVLIVGGTGTVGYMIHDPWPLPGDQAPTRVPPAYAKSGWDAARAIYAAVFFSRPDSV